MPRRGYQFENQIQKVCDYVEAIGGHAHKNHPERTVDGIYKKGEPFDYEIFLPNYKAVFDAKQCNTDTWNIVKKDIRQTNELKKCKNAGLKAYFLICFENKDVRQVDVDIVIEHLKNNKKSIKKDGLPKWELINELKKGKIK